MAKEKYFPEKCIGSEHKFSKYNYTLEQHKTALILAFRRYVHFPMSHYLTNELNQSRTEFLGTFNGHKKQLKTPVILYLCHV